MDVYLSAFKNAFISIYNFIVKRIFFKRKLKGYN